MPAAKPLTIRQAIVERRERGEKFVAIAAALPSQRTLQTWFRQVGLNRTASVRHSVESVKGGQTVHEVWAVDAKELIPLASGERVSWLTVTDEASGAILSGQMDAGGTAPGATTV
jgi:hypothetical protein